MKGVDSLGADVAQHQRRIIRGQTAPRSKHPNRHLVHFKLTIFSTLRSITRTR